MKTARQLHAPYEYVISENVVSTAVRLSQVAGDSAGNSLVLSTQTGSQIRLSSLEGLGKELWAGEDAQAYVSHLRDEWNHD